MNSLVTAVGLFAIGFVFHWLLWRIHSPRRAISSLLLIYLGTLAVGLICLHGVAVLQPFGPIGLWNHLRIVICYLAITLVYIINYSGLEEDSPSFTLVKFVALACEEGRSREDLDRVITDEMTVHSRLKALIQGGLVVRMDDRFVLTAKGRFWNRVFALGRRIYRVQKGG